MFHPNRWIKLRLKTFCVAFGIADVTLVLLSVIGWFFFFDISFQAQQDHLLLEYRSMKANHTTPSKVKLFPAKGKMKEEALRLERTIRACGLAYDALENELDQNFASPGAMIGASMGGYFILGTLLSSLGLIHSPTGRKIVCRICLVGEGLCTLLLFVAVAFLLANEALCPTEYYFESFQPIFQVFIYSLIVISSFKSYEITVILFYFLENAKLARREVKVGNAFRRMSVVDHHHHHPSTRRGSHKEGRVSFQEHNNNFKQVGNEKKPADFKGGLG